MIEFNISHSHDKVMCVISSDGIKLGCDIESVKEIVSADTAACSAALHLVAVLYGLRTECGYKFFNPHRVFGVAEVTVFLRLH